MSFKDNLVIRGGTAENRNKLLKHRTNDLIEQFMNEAKTTSTAIQFSFTSLWDILEPLYAGKDTDNYARALNLANYYLGFLNYRCDKVSFFFLFTSYRIFSIKHRARINTRCKRRKL